jgi:hypothetical protein
MVSHGPGYFLLATMEVYAYSMLTFGSAESKTNQKKYTCSYMSSKLDP